MREMYEKIAEKLGAVKGRAAWNTKRKRGEHTEPRNILMDDHQRLQFHHQCAPEHTELRMCTVVPAQFPINCVVLA